MMRTSHVQPSRRVPVAAPLELEMLERLPCGCVVAVQRVRPSGITVVSLEAKGPHCVFGEHRANRVIRLGDPVDADDGPGDEPSY